MDSKDISLMTAIAKSVGSGGGGENVIFDSAPTAGHNEPYVVTSAGIATAIGAEASARSAADDVLSDSLGILVEDLRKGGVSLTPKYIFNDTVVGSNDGTVFTMNGCVTWCYELDASYDIYHLRVTNRNNIFCGFSNTLFDGTTITLSYTISEPNVVAEFPNNAGYYKYLYVTKHYKAGATDNEYGVYLSTSILSAKMLGTLDCVDTYCRTICDTNTQKYLGFVRATDGSVVASDTFYATGYFEVAGITNLTLYMPVLTVSGSHAGIAFYDINKSYISGIECNVVPHSTGFEIRTVNVPNTAVYARTCCRLAEWDNFFVKHDEFGLMQNDISTVQTTLNLGLQMFEKIGVISDSISVGWARDKNGNNSRRNTWISWPQQMARRLGCTAYNLGASGVDPIEWFQPNYEFAQYCYTQYQQVGACDLYIIGLGLNQGTLGTIADIDENDYTQNASTFYGQYARIIQMINDEHPNAVVICLTEPTVAISSYDQAVRNICALSFINAELLDLENDYFDLFNSPEILAQRQPDNLHYTPYGYSLIAQAMVVAINDYISKNSASFKYVGVETV